MKKFIRFLFFQIGTLWLILEHFLSSLSPLTPSGLSENGRRLLSDSMVKIMPEQELINISALLGLGFRWEAVWDRFQRKKWGMK